MALPKIMDYTKNVVKSITYSAVDVVKTDMPSLAAYVDQDSNRELSRSIYAGIKDYKGTITKAKTAIKSSRIYEAADLGVKSALEDIKTGKFYNRERIDAIESKAAEAMFGSFEDMDLDMIFSEESNADITTGDRLVAASTHVSVIKAADMISQTQIATADAVIKSQKASTQALYTQGAQIIGSLKEVAFTGAQTQGAIVNLTDIQKTAAQNSKLFYESTTKILQETNNMMKEMVEMQRALYKSQARDDRSSNERMTYDDLVNYEGALDFKNYFKNVKQNTKSLLSNKSGGMFDLINGMDGSFLNMFAASPLQYLSTAILKAFIPANVSKSSKNFDKTLSGVASTILARFNNMANDSDNPVLQAIGEIFGVKNKVKSSLDSSKFNKGPVPFDGVVRKTIVDAIPTYLRRIEAALTGKPEKIYDPTKGNWTDIRKVSEDYNQMFRSNKAQANYDLVTEFNRVLNGKNAPKFSDKSSRDDFNKSLETFLDKLYEQGGDFKYRSKEDAYKYDINQDAFEQIVGILTNKDNKDLQRARIMHSHQVQSAKSSLNKRMQYLEEYADSPLFQLFNGSTESDNFKTPKYEDTPKSFLGSLNLNDQTDKYGNSVFYYLQNMYAELFTIRSSTGLSPVSASAVSGSGSISSTFSIQNNRVPNARDKYEAGQSEARRRYDEGIAKHTRQGGKLYDLVDTNGNIRMDRATVEQREILEQLEADNASHGWFNDILYGNKTSLDKANSKRAKEGESSITGKNLLDRMKATKNLSEKLAVLQDQVNKITKTPADQVNKLLEKADAKIYQFFYGDETGETDDEGNKITGFMQLMSMRLNVALDNFTNMIDDKIFTPIKKKFGVENMKDLLDKMGVTKIWEGIQDKLFGEKDPDGKRQGGIFGDTKKEIKRVFGSAKDYVVDSIKDVFRPVTSRVSSAMSNRRAVRANKTLSAKEITPEIANIIAAAATNPNNDALQEVAATALAVIEQPRNAASAAINRAAAKNNTTDGSSPAVGPVPAIGGSSIMAKVSETLNKILDTIQSVVREDAVVVKVKPKYQRTSSSRVLSHARMGRESETEGDSTGDSDGELHSSAFGNHFRKNSTSALSKGELYGRNGLFGKVPKTGVYDVKSGTTIYPTDKNKSIELAGEQSAIGKFLSKFDIPTNANADSRKTRVIDGKVFSLGDDGKWHNYQPNGKGGATDYVLEEGFLDQMYSTARGGLNSVLSGLGFSGLANTNAVTNIDSAMEVVKKYAPKMTANGLLGGAIGLLSGNPLLGATIGAVSGYVQSSERAQNMLFGEKTVDESGNEYRSGGMISKSTQDTVKKYLPNMGKYGVTGATLGLLTPFGVVGGAMIGSAVGWATTNDRIKEALFGDLKDEKSGLINKEFRDRVKKAAPSMAVGAIGGLLAGPFGVLGNLALGSGLGFISTTEGFKRFIFGAESTDEDGNKSRQGGLIGAIKINVVDPLKDFANTFKTKAEDFIINDMINPLKGAIKPITHEMGLLAKGMVGFVPKILGQIFESTFGRPLQDIIRDTIISPASAAVGKTAGLVGGIGKTVISAPFKLVGQVGKGLQSKHIRKGDASYISASERLAFRNDNRGRGILSNLPIVGNSIFGSLGMNPTGYRDKYRAVDETLASMEDPEQLKAAMNAMESLSKGKGYYKEQNRKTGRGMMAELSSVFPSGVTSRIKKAMERNDVNTLSNLIRSSRPLKGVDLPPAKREELINKSIETLKTIESNNRKSNLTNEERSNLFNQLDNMGFSGVNDKNVSKMHKLLQTEYDFKKNTKSEDKNESEENAKLVSDPIIENAKENTDNIINSLTAALDRIAEIQMASLPASKARKLLDKEHNKQKALASKMLGESNEEIDNSTESEPGIKWIFDSEANALRKYVQTADGWTEAHGKAKADADRSERERQETSTTSLASGLGARIKEALGGGINKETGEKKTNPVVDVLKKAAKVIGIGALGATAIAGTGHASQFVVDNVFPKVQSIWETKIQPFLKEHLGGLYDKISTLATDTKEFITSAPKRIGETVKTFGQWFSGTGDYAGAGLPYVFQSKILPWYLEGFEKFATIYLPPITKAIVVALPTIAKGLAKGVWAGIKTLMFDKDSQTEPDFNTNYNIDFSADKNIYAKSGSSLSRIKPVGGGSGWWNQRGTGLDSIFNFSNSKVTVPTSGKSKAERKESRDSLQSSINNSKGLSRAGYVSEAIKNAEEVDPETGKKYYNPAFMPLDSKGNTYNIDGSKSNDNSSDLFNPFGGAISYKDRLFKLGSRKLLGGGGGAGAFKLLNTVGKGISKLGPLGWAVGGGMKVAGKAGEGVVNHIPNLGRFIFNGNTVGNVAMNMGEAMTKSGRSSVSKIGSKIAGSSFAKLGADAFAKNSADLLVDKGLLKAGEEVISRTGAKVIASGSKNVAMQAVTETASPGLLAKITKAITEGIKGIFNSKAVVSLAKEGMEAAGKEVTEAAATKIVAEAGEGIAKSLVKKAGENLAKAGSKVLSKVTSAVATGGLAAAAFAAFDFVNGTMHARDILGLTKSQDVGIFERLLAGLLKCVNGFATLGLIPESVIVDIFIDFLAPLFNLNVDSLNKRRQASEEEVKAYNAENGKKYSVEEYNNKDSIMTKIKTGVKNGAMDIGSDVVSMFKASSKGNVVDLFKTGIDPKQGVPGLIKAVALTPLKIAELPPALLIGGIKAMSKLASPMMKRLANLGKDFAGNASLVGRGVLSGNLKEMMLAGNSFITTEGNVDPYQLLSNIGTMPLKIMGILPTTVIGGVKTAIKVLKPIVEPIIDTGKTAIDKLMNTGSYVINGDLRGLFQSVGDITDEDGSPSVGKIIGSLISASMLPILSIPTSVIGAGKAIMKPIKSLSAGIKEISVTDMMSKMWEYTNVKKHPTMEGFWDIGKSDGTNPIGDVTSSIVLSVGKHAVGIIRSLGYLGSFISKAKGGSEEAESAKAGSGKYGLGRVYQNDPRYASIPFNSSRDTVRQTIGNSGCGPAAAVNAVNYAYGTGSLEDAANMVVKGGYKEKNGGTTPGFFKSFFNKNGLQSNRLSNNRDILNSIQSGSPVVMMGTDRRGDNTPYGPNPHYVVGKGLDRNGNIIVDDPESRYGTSRYPASRVLGKTSIAISASRYGKGPMTAADLVGSLGSSNTWQTNMNYSKMALAKPSTSVLSEKEKYKIAFACLPYLDKPLSSVTDSAVMGPINSAVLKAGKTLSEGDKSKTVRTILSNYLQIRVGAIQDFASAIAKYAGVSLDDLRNNNSSLYNQLKSITQLTANLNIQDFGKKTVGEICSVIGLTFKGDAPINVKSYESTGSAVSTWDDMVNGYSTDMSSGDAAVKENIFDKISNLVKSFFSYTDKNTGETKNVLDIFGIGGGSSSSSSSSSGSVGGVGGSLSESQKKVRDAMSSIIGRNNYSQSDRYKVGASLEGLSQGSGDCSSTVQWALRKAGIDPGGDTGAQISSSAGKWIDGPFSFGKNGKPTLNNLALGDLMFYGTSKSGKPQNVSHVEMYWGDGKRIGHGSGIGPRVSGYADKSSAQQYLGSKRFIPIGSLSGSPNVAGGDVEQNKKTIWTFLKNKGYNEIATAGIMGNIGQECGFRHDLVQGNGKGPGVGICQWSSSGRKNAFLAAVPDWKTNLGGQLEFMYGEISSSYRQVLPSGLNRCGSVEEATKMFHDVYEKSNDYNAYGGISKRYGYATNVYQQFASTGGSTFGTGKYFSKAESMKSKYGKASDLGIVRGGNVTSTFDDPTRLNHKGIDIAAENGQAIISPVNGTVIRSEYSDTNGNMVVIQSNDGYLYSFYHMNSRRVQIGGRVSVGTILGTVGSTGNSMGDHVHYQVTDPNGQFVDPLSNKKSSIAKPQNKPAPRAIGGSDGIDYTQLIKVIIELLGTISDNTANFTKALNLISEKTGVDLSGIGTSSKSAALSKIKDKLKAIDSSYGRGTSDLGSSMMGNSTDYLVKMMSMIAQD